ncbi:hypothetical protein [Bizionia paragorgiae]|uniref:Collagen triple helix repeat-containing protein n=1 Tax=Bizionia paragorgiae TaxID=283786 RepID=A0A1H3WQ42_BIZPA|nr:hypothetical protein [Bizionia paragorgiae]SDZ88474.1 hypothetical protein SAMN04487990_103184 [Bizionia paragorgiae]
MKHLVLKTKYVVLALFVAFSFSCTPEDGEDGPIGPQGEQGIAGTDGIDGNANVQVLTIDMSTEAGSYDDVVVPELTQDIIENDVVLGYIKRGTKWFPVPAVADIIPFSVSVTISVGFYSLDYIDKATGGSYNIAAGDIDLLKIVIIEAYNSSRNSTNNLSAYEGLLNSGVDITNFEAVCDYFQIAY